MAPTPPEKPKLRGVPDIIGVVLAVPAVIACAVHAAPGVPTAAAALYGLGVLFLLSVSSLYHLPNWAPRARAWMRRVDHSAIFVLIVASYVPVCLVRMPDGPGRTLLAWVCGLGVVGVIKSLLWPTIPRGLNVLLYVGLSAFVGVYAPEAIASVTVLELWLLLVGGALYVGGALAYAFRRPNPLPGVFGYHEVFHVGVVAACGLHLSAVWSMVA